MAKCWKRAARCAGTLLTLFCVTSAPLVGSELEPRTVERYEHYVTLARRAFLVRPHRVEDASNNPSLTAVTLLHQGQITKIPGGLVHHWAGTVFTQGADLDQVMSVAQSYDDYAAIYGPVVSSRLLGRADQVFRVFARFKEDVSVLSAVLDVWTVVTFERRGSCAYSLGATSEIRQVRNVGQLDEDHFPVGRDSGYLWRANTFTKFVQRDSGVWVELETVGLSRRFPPFVGWIIEPIARRLGRASIERTLTEFRNAVLANVQRPTS